MSEEVKHIQAQLKELAKENDRFRKRTEEMNQRLVRDYEELMKSFYRMQDRTWTILEQCRDHSKKETQLRA